MERSIELKHGIKLTVEGPISIGAIDALLRSVLNDVKASQSTSSMFAYYIPERDPKLSHSLRVEFPEGKTPKADLWIDAIATARAASLAGWKLSKELRPDYKCIHPGSWVEQVNAFFQKPETHFDAFVIMLGKQPSTTNA
jgi:hypothetical protein